jgi:chromosome partitioning protein
MDDELLTIKDAALQFGVKYDRLRRAAYDGRLLTTNHFVTPAEVERFLREGRPRLAVVPRREGDPMGKIVAIALVKGGVAKSTTTLNLAAALAERGLRVLMIDTDHQCSLTFALGIRPKPTDDNLYTVIHRYITDYDATLDQAIVRTTIGADLVPASIRLSTMEDELLHATQRELVLKSLLIPVATQYDVVLIDTPPANNHLVRAALVAAHQVILPMEADSVSLESLALTLANIQRMRRPGLNPDLRIAGVLLTRVQAQTNIHREVMDVLQHDFGDQARLFATQIKNSVRIRESLAAHQSILTYEPKGPGATAYRALAEEVLDELGE